MECSSVAFWSPPLHPLNFLIQLFLVGLFLVAGLPDVLGIWVQDGSWLRGACLELCKERCLVANAWAASFSWAQVSPKNDHSANVVFAETPPVLSGGLAASEFPCCGGQKRLRRDASVGGPFLGWVPAKHAARRLSSSFLVTPQNVASLGCIDVGWVWTGY